MNDKQQPTAQTAVSIPKPKGQTQTGDIKGSQGVAVGAEATAVHIAVLGDVGVMQSLFCGCRFSFNSA